MRKSASERRSRQNVLLLVGILGALTLVNYMFYVEVNQKSTLSPSPLITEPPRTPAPITEQPPRRDEQDVVVESGEAADRSGEQHQRQHHTKNPAPVKRKMKPAAEGVVIETAPPVVLKTPKPVPSMAEQGGEDASVERIEHHDTASGSSSSGGDEEMCPLKAGPIADDTTDAPDPEINHAEFKEALKKFEANLKVKLDKNHDPHQNTKDYVDVNALPDHGVLLPHNASKATAHLHVHCDPSNTSFSPARDALCQQYLGNIHNMRSIKAMSSILDTGRTLKFKLYYYNNNLTAIVKVSQMKFFFESASEYLAYAVDRTLQLNRVPTTAYVPLPLDYMRAAAGVLSAFYSQWWNLFIPQYEYTKPNMVTCAEGDREKKCSLTAVQLWMLDVHSAVMSNLKLSQYKLDEHFVHKYYTPRSHHHFPPQPRRLWSVSELCDRFIFDFLIGNTDRGMNDHNNFVYGGCEPNHKTPCSPEEKAMRTKYPAKYAFIDHGSSFHSHKEPEDNPFTGNGTEICRFKRSTYETVQRFARKHGEKNAHKRPFIEAVSATLPKGIFNVIRKSIYKKMQERLDKIRDRMEACIAKYSEKEVLSLAEHSPDPMP